MRATTLIGTSFQLEVCTQNYEPLKSQESRESWVPTLGILGFPFGSPKTKWHLGVGPMARHKVYLRGKVVASPKFGSWWVLWVHVCLWFIRALKCSNYALTNLLFSLCRPVWIIELLVNLPNPIPKLHYGPLPLKCCESGNAPQLLSLLLFSPLDLQLSPSRSLRVCQLWRFQHEFC